MRGFTLVELIIVMAVFLTLLAVTYPSLISSQRRTGMTEAVTLLAADIRSQQVKAMTGDAGGSGSLAPYGVHFEADSYTIFPGSVYSAGNPANFTVDLDPQVAFSFVTFPDSQLVFAPGSGEVSNFVSNTYNLTISDTSEGLTRIITINKYGVITQIN